MSAPAPTVDGEFLTPSGLDWIRSTNASVGTEPEIRPGFIANTESDGRFFLEAVETSVFVCQQVSSKDDNLSEFLKRRLRSVPEVESVRVSDRVKNGRHIVSVWTSLRKDDRETRFRVYDVEQQLSDHFSELLFEFHAHRHREDAPDGDRTLYQKR